MPVERASASLHAATAARIHNEVCATRRAQMRARTHPLRKRHRWCASKLNPRVLERYEHYRANGAKLVHFGPVHSAAVESGAVCTRPRPKARRAERPRRAVRCA